VIGLDMSLQAFTIRLLLDHGKVIEFHGPANITAETTGAIVNAANSSLLGGGGVDGAIHKAGGPDILAECRQIVSKMGSLSVGKAVITTGGNLLAKYVIHTVGPVYRGGERGEPAALASCHRESILIADHHAIESMAFPAISTGAFGYPLSEAAPIAVSSVIKELPSAAHVTRVRFVLFDVATLRAYTHAAEKLSRSNAASSLRIEKSSSCEQN
jgi:O-acetyl-ADP-ribose deacetylase (regulator of RNase III)